MAENEDNIEELIDEDEVEEPGFGEPINEHIKENLKEKAKEKGTEYLQDQAAKKATKEAGKEVGKEAVKETGTEAAKQAGKTVAKEAGKAVVKEGGKKGVEAVATVAAPETAGLSLIVTVGVEALDKLGILDLIINAAGFLFKWGARIIGLIILLILIMILMIGMWYNSVGKKGGFGSETSIGADVEKKSHYYDVLDLLAQGSKEEKLKLIKEKTADIIRRLKEEQESMKAMDPGTKGVEESIQIIDEMIPLIKEIAELGKQIDSSEKKQLKAQIADEDKYKEIKKKIDEKYEKLMGLWEKYHSVNPMFKENPYVQQYVQLMRSVGIAAEKRKSSGDFYDLRDGGKRYHYGYDINQPDGSDAIAGWSGTVVAEYYCFDNNNNDMGVLVRSGIYDFHYNHIKAGTIKVAPGQSIEKGTVLGTVYEGHDPVHIDIKIRKNGKYFDWGNEAIQ